MKAQAVAERAAMVPGYDQTVVERNLLESMDTPNSAELYPMVPEQDEQGNETGNLVLKFPPQPDPSLEIQKADMQRRTLEGQARAEKDEILAESTLKVNEAKIIEIMAKAALEADSPDLERLKLLQKDQQSLREQLVEREKIDASKQIAKSKPRSD